MQRWALCLGVYTYKLPYVPGKQMPCSGALSRPTQQVTGDGGQGPSEESDDWRMPADSSVCINNYGHRRSQPLVVSNRRQEHGQQTQRLPLPTSRGTSITYAIAPIHNQGTRSLRRLLRSRLQPEARYKHSHQCNHSLGSGRHV